MVTAGSSGNILLEKFELNPDEMKTVNEAVQKYAEKIGRLVNYERIRLEMKVHKKGKNSHFEIMGLITFPGGRASSEERDVNPFVSIDKVMARMLAEIEHLVGRKK